jgi:hypothetical protein
MLILYMPKLYTVKIYGEGPHYQGLSGDSSLLKLRNHQNQCLKIQNQKHRLHCPSYYNRLICLYSV